MFSFISPGLRREATRWVRTRCAGPCWPAHATRKNRPCCGGHPALQLHDQQHGGQPGGRQSGALDELIHIRGVETDRLPQAVVVGVAGARPGADRAFGVRASLQPQPERLGFACRRAAERLQDVGRRLHERGAVADQPVAAAGERVADRARQREHLAARVGGQARGDHRARPLGRLDHDGADAQRGQQAVAAGEVFALRAGAGQVFGDERAVAGNARLQVRVGSAGRSTSGPVPSTATVAPFTASAAAWAAASMPAASPLPTTNPASAKARAKSAACASPAGVGPRLPTTAIVGRHSSAGSPSTNSASGGLAAPRSAGG